MSVLQPFFFLISCRFGARHQSMPQHRALRSDVLECNSQVEDTQPPSSLTSQPEGTALTFRMFRTELRGAGLLFPPSPLPHPASWSSWRSGPLWSVFIWLWVLQAVVGWQGLRCPPGKPTIFLRTFHEGQPGGERARRLKTRMWVK